jgi:hypothetical protein
MNYGIYFSEELQKQGARAIPSLDVALELFRRGELNAIGKGFISPKIIDPLVNKQNVLKSQFFQGGDAKHAQKFLASKWQPKGFVASLRADKNVPDYLPDPETVIKNSILGAEKAEKSFITKAKRKFGFDGMTKEKQDLLQNILDTKWL